MTGRFHSFSEIEAAPSVLAGRHPDGPSSSQTSPVLADSARLSSPSGKDTPSSGSGSPYHPRVLTLPPVSQLLQGIGVIELLEQDPRPTFIVDLADPDNFNPGPLQMIFVNASLRAAPVLLDLLSADTTDVGHSSDFSRFKAWVISVVKQNDTTDSSLPSMSYGGISWTCSTLRGRFRLISGNISTLSLTPLSSSRGMSASSVLDQQSERQQIWRGSDTPATDLVAEAGYFGDVAGTCSTIGLSHSRSQSEPRSKSASVFDCRVQDDRGTLAPKMVQGNGQMLTFDWTRVPLDTPDLHPHIRFARSVDWGSTPLGPMEDWPADLRSLTNMIMGNPRPAAIYWGPEFIAIYNEAYAAIAGQKHPRLMGMRYRDSWPEIWQDVEQVFEHAWTSGQATMKHEDRLFVVRNGYLEETFFNWSIVPLIGSDGSVVALYNPTFDDTRRKVNERWMLILHEVGERTSQARCVKSFWAEVKAGLETNAFDIPMALIYSVSEDGEEGSALTDSDGAGHLPQVLLEGSLGVPDGHPAAVPSMNLDTSDEGFAPYMRDSLRRLSHPSVLRREDGTLPKKLVDGLAWRGFGDPCRTVVVFPIHRATQGGKVIGFVVLGVNPRRPYDEDYELFVNILSRQLATSLVSVALFEEEIKRGQMAATLAALDRQELSMQLRLRTQEAVESEYRFTRMAEFAPVGMFIADHQGIINYCNDTWWEISRHPRSAKTVNEWMQSIRDEDRPKVQEVWRRLIEEKSAITHEFRFKSSRQTADGHHVDTWVLMNAYPERDEFGSLKSIFGCITDISQQKWAEDLEKQRREEAVEMKRQQENFIDITSHEMRNPLSAILQCADEISGILTTYQSNRLRYNDYQDRQTTDLEAVLNNCIEAANTISLCANHQKRIVDDILTLSKLDSQLLLVTPVDVQPVVVVGKVLKMFEAELKSHDINGEFQIDQSFADLGVDWYKLDPSRLRQVMINLMTNAIKFTQGRERRSITISLGASKDISESSLSFFPRSRADPTDPTDEPEWGDGDKINLLVSVSDTGPGLEEEEEKMLFQRFAQASPRTHVQYGGSGLGLFICRTLTELQGGQITVTSQKGVGSTFAFYIKTRASRNPSHNAGTMGPAARARSDKFCEKEPRFPRSGQAAKQVQDLNGSSRRENAPGKSIPDDSLNILIVEDNLVNQKVLQRQLRIFGSNTHVANHGGEALEALRHSHYWKRSPDSGIPYDWRDQDQDKSIPLSSMQTRQSEDQSTALCISVILMDLEMPVMDGMTCARKIRELEKEGILSRHIPIIAVTAYARPEQIASAKAAGIDDVISKPFRIPELLPKIEELVAKYQTSSPASSRVT
ncbi:hypothetical protein VTK73DRAFT_5296 [Phialemonium thermophilum]|uniref:Histidine kinase n=1 Tax=Phialemonium thermophilum TaxID=223376 RepID=A0ABR3WNZ9_9PEZI